MPDTALAEAYTALGHARAVVSTALCSPAGSQDTEALQEAQAAARTAARLLNRAAVAGESEAALMGWGEPVRTPTVRVTMTDGYYAALAGRIKAAQGVSDATETSDTRPASRPRRHGVEGRSRPVGETHPKLPVGRRT